MESKVLSVFYGTDLLPYKDSDRTVHYPVGGNAFAGSNNTNQIRFYVDQIGGTSGVSWVVVSKLPNGTLGYEIISNVASDSDLGEDYLLFSLSSYYTQYKGVVKLALRGYQGSITFTDSDSDGVYEINGDPLIEVTGTIDLAINYSPFVNTSTEILPTDMDSLIASLSGYTPLGNSIVVLSAIPSDLSAYNEGQVFYNKADKLYYIYTNSEVIEYDMGFLPNQEISAGITFEEIYEKNGIGLFSGYMDSYFVVGKLKSSSGEKITVYRFGENIEVWYEVDTVDWQETLQSVLATTPTYTYARQDWVSDNFLQLSFETTNTTTLDDLYSEFGEKPFIMYYNYGDAPYEGYWLGQIFVASSTYYFEFERIGNPYSTSTYRYAGNSGGTVTLAMVFSTSSWLLPYATQDYVDDNFVDLTSSQTISGAKTFSGANTFSGNNTFSGTNYVTGRFVFSGYANLYNSYLDTNNKNYFARVGITTGQYVTYKLPYNYSDVGATTYTLATIEDVNSAISTLKANSFIVVDYTDTYPTLDDFLASTGEEGYIYLYPIDTSDLTKGYYQYIWESNAWLDIGTTQIDLSDYVEKTTTIAGIDLQDNITSSELLTALGLEFTDVEIDEE